jgi:hypothetical protein
VSYVALAGAAVMFAQAGSGLHIPAVRASLDVDGQPLTITAWGDVSPVSGQTPGQFRLDLTADLSDLQKNLTPLVRSQLNRDERCGERLSVESASLVPASPAGIFTANVHYERWGCAKVLGKEVVKRLVGGNGLVEVRLTPSADARGIALASEVQRVEADGSLGELLRTGSVGAAVRQKIASSVQKAIEKGTNFQSILPSALNTRVTIRTVQFAAGGSGELWLSTQADAQITADQFRMGSCNHGK